MNLKAENILEFLKFTDEFRKVERNVKIKGRDRMENDIEHSFQLAMICWYLVESDKLPLDKNLIIQYSLIHDLLETYAGDVDPYISDKEIKENKSKNEEEARKKITSLFPNFNSLSILLENYKEKKDDESKFVYALDKLLPVLNTYIASDDYYSRNGITFQKWFDYNGDKVKISPEIEEYFKEISNFVEKQKWIFAK